MSERVEKAIAEVDKHFPSLEFTSVLCETGSVWLRYYNPKSNYESIVEWNGEFLNMYEFSCGTLA